MDEAANAEMVTVYFTIKFIIEHGCVLKLKVPDLENIFVK